jgi:hypothetical protein
MGGTDDEPQQAEGWEEKIMPKMLPYFWAHKTRFFSPKKVT